LAQAILAPNLFKLFKAFNSVRLRIAQALAFLTSAHPSR